MVTQNAKNTPREPAKIIRMVTNMVPTIRTILFLFKSKKGNPSSATIDKSLGFQWNPVGDEERYLRSMAEN
jgi:hypothetical protein